MLAIVVGFCLSECPENTRLEFYDGLHVVSNCYFYDLESRVGGAIFPRDLTTLGAGLLSVHTTIFRQCRAIDTSLLVDAYGGTICSEGDFLLVEHCCFSETSAETWGSALSYKNPGSLVKVVDGSFHRCYLFDDSAGTVDDQQATGSMWFQLNFSYCA
jgi:hypothetical protein